jgi:hypothetical protein
MDINKINKLSQINVYYSQYYTFLRSVLINLMIFIILTLIVVSVYKAAIIPVIFITIATIILLSYILITLALKWYQYTYSDSNNFDEIVFPFKK